jgi:hypothetical protein
VPPAVEVPWTLARLRGRLRSGRSHRCDGQLRRGETARIQGAERKHYLCDVRLQTADLRNANCAPSRIVEGSWFRGRGG